MLQFALLPVQTKMRGILIPLWHGLQCLLPHAQLLNGLARQARHDLLANGRKQSQALYHISNIPSVASKLVVLQDASHSTLPCSRGRSSESTLLSLHPAQGAGLLSTDLQTLHVTLMCVRPRLSITEPQP